MTGKHAMPDLFGRGTLVLHGGHRGLREAAEALRSLCDDLRSGTSPASLDLTGRVDGFCDRVLIHLSAEEEAEYFGTLSAESDTLLKGIVRLKREHDELRRVIERLRGFPDLERNGAPFASLLEGFLDRLLEHEIAESVLLQRFFSADDGA